MVSTLTPADRPQLVLAFGDSAVIGTQRAYDQIARAYPDASVLLCSTGGEICGTEVSADSIVTTAFAFDTTRVATAVMPLNHARDSAAAGAALARALPREGLRHVFVLSEGVSVNGSALVRGLTQSLDPEVVVTGALSGDGDRFQQTLVGLDGPAASGQVAAVGLYGDDIHVGFGSLGGWETFGPDRLITRSEDNILYELDGVSALALYKRYLGPHAAELPASGLMFPLSLRAAGGGTSYVRTILGIDESAGSLIFAGDVPTGMYARLMRTNLDRLIDGAAGAASATDGGLLGSAPDVAILISCIGRKLVLRQRVEEEVENVRDVLGASTILAGFYSYGEISPLLPTAACELHNQTMTITTFAERCHA